jgi:large subunit ribosomal protein L15
VAAGIAKASDQIKILGKGKLTSKVSITVHAASESAKAAIEAAGGNVQTV